MKLSELVYKLETYPLDKVFRSGFSAHHTFRAYPNELVFEPAVNVSVASMLAHTNNAANASFAGCTERGHTLAMMTPVHVAAQDLPAVDDNSIATLFRIATLDDFESTAALHVEVSQLREANTLLGSKLDKLVAASTPALAVLVQLNATKAQSGEYLRVTTHVDALREALK